MLPIHTAIARVLPFALLLLSGCTTPGPASAVAPVGSEIAFEGRLTHIDTTPWAYDGNARLLVESESHGRLAVELPARWNLCRAQPFGDIGRYAAGDRVRVTGTVTDVGTVTVCAQPTHSLARLP